MFTRLLAAASHSSITLGTRGSSRVTSETEQHQGFWRADWGPPLLKQLFSYGPRTQATSFPWSPATKKAFPLGALLARQVPAQSYAFRDGNSSRVFLGRQRMFLSENQVNKSTPLFWITCQKLKRKQFACSWLQLLRFCTESTELRSTGEPWVLQGNCLQAGKLWWITTPLSRDVHIRVIILCI